MKHIARGAVWGGGGALSALLWTHDLVGALLLVLLAGAVTLRACMAERDVL